MNAKVKRLKLVIKAGTIKAIYDDCLTSLFPLGDVTVKRASRVEPDHSSMDGSPCWCADLSPVGGPMLTDFPTRTAALQAEVQYLDRKVVV
jgi:hypothetical protein